MRRLLLTIIILIAATSVAAAKIYWLPDFLGKNMDRNAGSRGYDTNIVCPAGWVSPATTTGLVCSKKQFFSGVGWCYQNCVDPCSLRLNITNDIDYGCKKTWDDCASKCEIPYTDNCHNRTDVDDSDYGCAQYWSDCPAKCETAVSDPCQSKHCQNLTCTYGCKTPCANCSAKCNECVEACDSLPDNTSDYGCDKYWADCPSKCEIGTVCTPKDCSDYTLTEAPNNAQYETCVKGCGDTTIHYRLVSCLTGYVNLDTYWCNGALRCFWK